MKNKEHAQCSALVLGHYTDRRSRRSKLIYTITSGASATVANLCGRLRANNGSQVSDPPSHLVPCKVPLHYLSSR
jgi:hypothetical protein